MDSRQGSYPRVLFMTSAAFNRITGGGITFSNLFRGWPTDRLATVHNDVVPVSSDVCQSYYRLGPGELHRWLLGARTESGPAPAVDQGSHARANVARSLKKLVIGNAWPDRGILTASLEAWIAERRPEVLYTILGTIGMMELVDQVRRRFSLPLVVHFMDDWPSTLYRDGLFSGLPRAHMRSLIDRLVKAATLRLAIGEEMKAAYEKRYQVPFAAFQNPADLAALKHLPSRPATNPARLVYAGSIFDNAQAQSLIDIARVVAALVARGQSLRLDIFSPSHLATRFRSALEVSPAVRLHEALDDDRVFFTTIQSASLLVLPVNFDRKSIRFIRYSMPTKVPAYLASGVPILAYGPREVAQIAYAAREGWGVVVDKAEPALLEAGILLALEDDDVRRRVTEAGWRTAIRNHDAATVRSAFQNTLMSAAP